LVKKGKMVSICFYFQVHQPCRLRKYSVFDIGVNHNYFDEQKNKEVIQKVARKCYLPANEIMLQLINKSDGKFKISYSLTGCVIEQFEKYSPEVLESFEKLAKTGNVEFLSETYNHSLASIFSKRDFIEQVNIHQKKIKELFGQSPRVFRNTELIFNNEIANNVQNLGFKGILAEGADHVLQWRSPNYVYTAKTDATKHTAKMKLLLKNYRLSDDIAFRFSEKTWSEWPLTVEKYARWINNINGNGHVVNLFMDYETFGEHQWEDKGIFEFIRLLPYELSKHPDNDFVTPSEAIERYNAVGELDIHHIISWADVERDLSAWLGNRMQNEAINGLYSLESDIKNFGSPALIGEWRNLQISDHFYYMCTKWFNDGDVHKYFNPYDSPYDAFIAFMNILNDFKMRLKSEKEHAYRRASLKIKNLLNRPKNSKLNKYPNQEILKRGKKLSKRA